MTDHLLRHDLIANASFEVFEGNALLLRLFLQVVHAFQLELLAQIVEPLHQLGVAGDSQVLALAQQQLLIDQVTQDIFFFFFSSRIRAGNVLLLQLLLKLFPAPGQVRTGNDRAVDAGDDLFDYRVGGERTGEQQNRSDGAPVLRDLHFGLHPVKELAGPPSVGVLHPRSRGPRTAPARRGCSGISLRYWEHPDSPERN